MVPIMDTPFLRQRPPTGVRAVLVGKWPVLARLVAAMLLLSPAALNHHAHAELRVVTASGEYRMGDRDTREDAIKFATETAKRHALEQVATYLDSITVVRDLDLTQDEIHAYTAGVVVVVDRKVTTRLDGETVVVRVDLTAQVDGEEVVRAITALRQHADARRELVALKAEVDRLRQQLDATTQALAEATTPQRIRALREQRQDLLNSMQSDALVSQAWIDWVMRSAVLALSPWVNAAHLHALIAQAQQLDPSNPRLRIAQQVMTAGVPPAPPQPPPPPALPRSSPAMPTYQVVPREPPTLNLLPPMPIPPPPEGSPLSGPQTKTTVPSSLAGESTSHRSTGGRSGGQRGGEVK